MSASVLEKAAKVLGSSLSLVCGSGLTCATNAPIVADLQRNE
ncbi:MULTISPECIES: hypothetical protein [Propionibacteriaceae]|nr:MULTISPECIES: hypothetical protein [Propionibacteriaceae]MEA5053087.1 hypothetical protein [Propionicimonas sp.]